MYFLCLKDVDNHGITSHLRSYNGSVVATIAMLQSYRHVNTGRPAACPEATIRTLRTPTSDPQSQRSGAWLRFIMFYEHSTCVCVCLVPVALNHMQSSVGM